MSDANVVTSIIATCGDWRLIHQFGSPSDRLVAALEADENGFSYQVHGQRGGDWVIFRSFDCAGHLNHWLNVVAIDPPDVIYQAAELLPDSPSLFDPSGLEVVPLAEPDAPSGSDRVARPELAPAALAALAPLDAAARRSDDDWPGVLVRLGDDVRVVVNAEGTRYAVQNRWFRDGRPVWSASPSYGKMSSLLAKQAGNFDGLSEAVEHLPDDPAQAMPELIQAWADLALLYELTDWRRDDYGRVIRQDTQLRVVVDDLGQEYRLQWAKAADFRAGGFNDWLTLFKSPFASALLEFITGKVYIPGDGPDDFAAIRGRAELLLSDLPANCVDGVWPDLPDRPVPLRHRNTS